MAFDSDSFKSSIEFQNVESFYSTLKENINEINRLLPTDVFLVSFLSDYRQQFAKVFVIACASSFEKKFYSFLPDLLGVNDCELKKSFIQKHALNRKYHTLFGWDKGNANSFFGLFGENFKNIMTQKRREDPSFRDFESAFLILGKYRNEIAHNGIVGYSFDRDIDSVYKLFQDSLAFITIVFNLIDEHSNI